MSSAKIELKFSDNGEQNSFYRRFKNLDSKPSNTLRVADRGEYYTILDSDALVVAETIYKTKSVLKENQHGSYVTISSQVFSNLVKEFVIDQGYKIELYDRQWKLLKNISPGNLQDVEDLVNYTADDVSSNQIIAALKFMERSDGKYIGIGYLDSSNKYMGYTEFIDNDLFSNLESTLLQLNIKEILIGGLADEKNLNGTLAKLIQVINRCEITISDVKNSSFNTNDADQDLRRLLTDEAYLAYSTAEVQSKTLAIGGLCALIFYLNLLNDDSSYNTFELKTYVLGKYMKLDLSAVKALNLFPTSRDQGTKTGSIFGVLNHCKSAEGTRLLSQWIKQPLTNLQEITNRHLLVGFLIEDSETRCSIQDDVLTYVPDIRRLTRKLSKGKANLEDVVRIYQLILKIPDLLQYLESAENNLESQNFSFLNNQQELIKLRELINSQWLKPFTENSNLLYKLQEMVESTIDLDALDNNEYNIRPEFNEDLMEIKEKLEKLTSKIKTCHLSSADDLNKDAEKKLKLENHVNHGWCMRLTRTDASVLRGKTKYIELQTVKAGVFFTTSELRSVSEKYHDLQSEYNKTQSSVVKEIIDITNTYCPILEKLSSLLAEIDVIISFSHVSSYAPKSYIRPKLYEMNDSQGKTLIKEARHPCLEMQDDVSFIANDIELQRNKTEFLIITGPNMGGKSTYIKSVGTMNLLAQIGCFVPATEAELCLVDAILARIGAGDSQLKGISTFMAEMLEMSSILKTATANSLIIIDELGRGTSTYDGFGLAYSISEHLAKETHCFTLFATHFHELTALSEKIPTIKNLHVVAHVDNQTNDSNDITLLYKVEPGISDQSFGIHVAEVVQFPQKIISMSKRKASELEDLGGKNDIDDPYVADKRTKCNTEEIINGSQLLKKILKKWKNNNYNWEEKSNEEIVNDLKKLVEVEHNDEIKNDKFLQEVLSL